MSMNRVDEVDYMTDESEMGNAMDDEMEGNFFDGDRGQGEADDEYDLLTRVTDTSSAQARSGRDIQGIPWDRLQITRQNYRQTRIQQYKNYENIPSSGELMNKKCKQVEKGGNYYEFQYNTRLVKPTILHFQAFDLGRGRNCMGCMVEEIFQTLAQAKYMEWELSSSNHAWRLQSLKEACEKALAEYHFLDNSLAEDASKDAADDRSEQLELLNEVFCKAAQADMPTQVPDYLCCKITLDIFRDPVITPSGVTYERAVLLEHLKQVGKFDPVTREPLEQHQLVPNLAIKQAVQAYLNEHGWAYKSS